MAVLKQLTCNLEWAGSRVPLPEYQTVYADGLVQTYVAVPPTPAPFEIHLESKGYIAPGLAMYVYMDGVYQCNRNRHNLQIPCAGIPEKRTNVNFRVRQKEVMAHDGGFEAKRWRFEKVNIVSDSNTESSQCAPSSVESVGTVTVIVLRCCSPESLTPESPIPVPPSLDILKMSPKQVSFSPKKASYLEPQNSQTVRTRRSEPKLKSALKSQPQKEFRVFSLDGSWDVDSEGKDEFWDALSQSSSTNDKQKENKREGWQPSSHVTQEDNSQMTSAKADSDPTTQRSTTNKPIEKRKRGKPQSDSKDYFGSAWQTSSHQDGAPGDHCDKADPTSDPVLHLRGGGPGSYSPSVAGSPNVVININNGPPSPGGWVKGVPKDHVQEPAANDPWSKDDKTIKSSPDVVDKKKDSNVLGQDMPGAWDAQDEQGNANNEWNTTANDNGQKADQWTTAEDKSWNQDEPWTVTGNGGDWDQEKSEEPKKKNKTKKKKGNGGKKAKNGWNDNWDANVNDGDQNDKEKNQKNGDWDAKVNGWDQDDKGKEQTNGDWDGGDEVQADPHVDDQQNGSWDANEAKEADKSTERDEAKQSEGAKTSNQKGKGKGKNKNKGKGNGNGKGRGKGSKNDQQVDPEPVPETTTEAQQEPVKQKADSPKPEDASEAVKPPSKDGSNAGPVPGAWSPQKVSPEAQEEPLVIAADKTSALARTTSPSPTGLKLKPYWKLWRDADHIEKSLDVAKLQESIHTLPEEIAQRSKASHQVRPGPSSPYFHQTSTPRYLDTLEKPYAVFVFHYRDEETIEKMLKPTIVKPEIDEKQRLAALSKDELIEELMKANSKSSSNDSKDVSDKASVKSNPNGVSMEPDVSELKKKLSKLEVTKQDKSKSVKGRLNATDLPATLTRDDKKDKDKTDDSQKDKENKKSDGYKGHADAWGSTGDWDWGDKKDKAKEEDTKAGGIKDDNGKGDDKKDKDEDAWGTDSGWNWDNDEKKKENDDAWGTTAEEKKADDDGWGDWDSGEKKEEKEKEEGNATGTGNNHDDDGWGGGGSGGW